MNKKQLIVLICAAVVLAIAAYVMNRPEKRGWQGGAAAGTTLVPESFDSSAVTRVTFSSGDKTVTLEKTEPGWSVKERYGFPANFSELNQFVFDLSETRVARELAIAQQHFAELQLTPADGAVTVSFHNAAGDALQTLVFGKKHEQESAEPAMPGMMPGENTAPVGRYLLLNDQRPVIAANTFALVDEPVTFWLNKDFFKISDLKSATLSAGDVTMWTVERKSKSDNLAVVGEIPEGKEADTSKLNSIKSAFSWIRFNDVADPAAKPEDVGMDEVKTFTATDFDDLSYTILIGKTVNGKRYLRISELTWNGKTTRDAAEDEKPEDKARLDAEFAQKVKDGQTKAQELFAKLAPWTFEVGTYAISNIDKKRDELFKDLPKPEPKADATPAPAPAPAAPAPAAPAPAAPAAP
ncbi:DUF4340 domain-containing protein [Oligosphaera ethanolica]|uniref:DUF4340 domain-containing protein n=1 Tax=Oligosphaera ethanolica TaxID=760260 RepID=A0AAE3VEZ4_9BACT|nr:DUF4340 domain-containing protein [Oligosphaera ethanolica]MDQ0289186.1 hypothetical protein [Oligosphaera ethanolica]